VFLSGLGPLNESENVKSSLDGSIANPADKKPSSTNLFTADIRNNHFVNEKKI